MHGCVFKGAFGILRQTTKFAVDQQEKLRKDDKGQRHSGHSENFKVVSLDVHIARKMWRYFAPGLAPEIRPPSNRGEGMRSIVPRRYNQRVAVASAAAAAAAAEGTRGRRLEQEVVGEKAAGLGFPGILIQNS